MRESWTGLCSVCGDLVYRECSYRCSLHPTAQAVDVREPRLGQVVELLVPGAPADVRRLVMLTPGGDRAMCVECGYGIPAGTGDEITRGPICDRCNEEMHERAWAEEYDAEHTARCSCPECCPPDPEWK